MNLETFILPAHWASALINSDLSGLEDSDINELEKFIRTNKEDNHLFMCINCSEDQYFTHYNDARTLSCDVLEYTFDVSPL